MAASSKTTTDHKTIQKWIEDRGGKPAAVKNTEKGSDPGMLRVDFPGHGEDAGRGSLDPISWDDFFRKFDEKNLVFLYQDEMKDGKPSRFFKFVSRETAGDKGDEGHKDSSGHKREEGHHHEEKRDTSKR